MKKISIIGLSALLAACSTGTYTTDVSTDTYQEEYQQPVVAQTLPAEASMAEESVVEKTQPVATEQVAMVQSPQVAPQPIQQTQAAPSKRVVKLTPDKKVKLLPPTAPQKQQVQRFGYTLQVVALDSSAKAVTLAERLPAGHPVWEHYKQVNGTNWYTLLYGDYATKPEAKAAIATLPEYFRQLKPFVKSLDDIKNSDYPKLRKLK